MKIEPIAVIRTPFEDKFGIPRQSGTTTLSSRIIFYPKYRNPTALSGLDEFSHIWLIWEFTKAKQPDWSPTVRPPKLGGNKRIGVFATRSPFRPNSLGLSCVRLESIEIKKTGPELVVTGADLLDKTPIYDIKPYLPAFDRPSNAAGGYSDQHANDRLHVDFPEPLLERIPLELQQGLIELLSEDPRPSYHNDPSRIYGMRFSGYEIRFCVIETVLSVVAVEKIKQDNEFEYIP